MEVKNKSYIENTEIVLLAGGIISAAHEFKVVGAVGDGPAYAVGIGHVRHFQRAFLLPFDADSKGTRRPPPAS
jgi:hypothetical protein